jgi:hypothetical protein
MQLAGHQRHAGCLTISKKALGYARNPKKLLDSSYPLKLKKVL